MEFNFEINLHNELFEDFTLGNSESGIKKYLKDGFAYEIFADFNTPNISWICGGFVDFFEQFLLTIEYFPTTQVSYDFEELIRITAIVQAMFSNVELIYFLKALQKFIDWNKRTEFQFINNYIPSYQVLANTPEILSCFYFQIESLINFTTNRDNSKDKYGVVELKRDNEALVEEKKKSATVQETTVEEKVKTVLQIVDFLNGLNRNYNSRYMSKEDFSLLQAYLDSFVRMGKFIKRERKIGHVAIDQGSIIYTFYIINKFLYRRKRNPQIFNLLANAFEDLEEFAGSLDENLSENYLYKKFSEQPKFYSEHNPFGLELQKSLGI